MRQAILTLALYFGCCLPATSLARVTTNAEKSHFDPNAYIYIAPGYPGYDGGRIISAFIPYQPHHNSGFWWDTGVLSMGISHQVIFFT